MGQLFDFILAGVGMDEVGSASGVLEAVQQLSSAIGVAALGTIFFSAFAGHLPTHALAITAWACLVADRRRVRAHLPAADARPRATDLTGRGKQSAAVAGVAAQAPRTSSHTASAAAAAPHLVRHATITTP